jgi:hypothetical protein
MAVTIPAKCAEDQSPWSEEYPPHISSVVAAATNVPLRPTPPEQWTTIGWRESPVVDASTILRSSVAVVDASVATS